jgi:hypothetical protein
MGRPTCSLASRKASLRPSRRPGLKNPPFGDETVALGVHGRVNRRLDEARIAHAEMGHVGMIRVLHARHEALCGEQVQMHVGMRADPVGERRAAVASRRRAERAHAPFMQIRERHRRHPILRRPRRQRGFVLEKNRLEAEPCAEALGMDQRREARHRKAPERLPQWQQRGEASVGIGRVFETRPLEIVLDVDQATAGAARRVKSRRMVRSAVDATVAEKRLRVLHDGSPDRRRCRAAAYRGSTPRY